VDGLTWSDYGVGLEGNLASLHDRVQREAYRALPSRRRYIPKSDGRQRPLAIAALEDKPKPQQQMCEKSWNAARREFVASSAARFQGKSSSMWLMGQSAMGESTSRK